MRGVGQAGLQQPLCTGWGGGCRLCSSPGELLAQEFHFQPCRMLDEYFEEQMKEIIRLCARHRQTMLFSATMTDEVVRWVGQEVGKGTRKPLQCWGRGGQNCWEGLPPVPPSACGGRVCSDAAPSFLAGGRPGLGLPEISCPSFCEQQHRCGPVSAPRVCPHPAHSGGGQGSHCGRWEQGGPHVRGHAVG